MFPGAMTRDDVPCVESDIDRSRKVTGQSLNGRKSISQSGEVDNNDIA